MESQIQDSKAALRRRIREQLRALTGAQRAAASEQARALLRAQPRWREAKALLFFAPLPEEPDVWPLLEEALRAGKRAFLPRFVEGDEKPLKRLKDSQSSPNTLLKQGVNENEPSRDAPLEKGVNEELRTERASENHGHPRNGRYVVCEVREPDKDICLGRFGIREPAENCAEPSLNRLDLILVPGVAFDLHGRRLGRGRGFYDRMLAGVRGTTCGVAFDQQIVGEIPVDPHDIHLNCILTPTRWIEL